MASSGSALSISSAARCGLIGVESSEDSGGDELVPFQAIAVDRHQPFLARVGALVEVGAAIELGENLAQERPYVSHQAERDRIIAADLLRIDVDMNELRRRNGEGIARNPGTGGAVVEAHAERKQHVGLAGGVVGLVVAGAGDQTERQRMLGIDARRDPLADAATGICRRSASRSSSSQAPP